MVLYTVAQKGFFFGLLEWKHVLAERSGREASSGKEQSSPVRLDSHESVASLHGIGCVSVCIQERRLCAKLHWNTASGIGVGVELVTRTCSALSKEVHWLGKLSD